MPDFYEIDFLPVHTSKSGDAITMRYQNGPGWDVHVVDGGYTSTAPDLAAHIRTHFGTNRINRIVVTHPDRDHAEGLGPILEEFTVEELWMLCPWRYARELLPYFARYTSAQSPAQRLQNEYPYIAELERIAIRRNIQIFEPFQGARIGAFTVLAPSPARYLRLIIQSDKTPQQTPETKGILSELMKFVEPTVTFVKTGWWKLFVRRDQRRNEMSVVQGELLLWRQNRSDRRRRSRGVNGSRGLRAVCWSLSAGCHKIPSSIMADGATCQRHCWIAGLERGCHRCCRRVRSCLQR
jgi:hypothetical protein